MRFISFFFIALCVFPLSAFAVNQAEPENPLITLCFYVNRIEAVRTDMERFARYRQGSTGFWEDETQKALGQLGHIRAEAASLHLTDEFAGIRRDLIVYIEALAAYTRKFREGFPEHMGVYEGLLQIKRTALREKVLDALTTGESFFRQENNIDPWDEELRLFPEGRPRVEFLKGAALLEEKKYEESCVVLKELLGSSQGLDWRGSVLLRLVRSVLKDRGGSSTREIERECIDWLGTFIEEGVYSPLLVEIFVFWRLLYQGFYYGWDKKADIPNGLYQERSERAAQTLRERIAVHPQDRWARLQLVLLATTPVLSRGTDAFFLAP